MSAHQRDVTPQPPQRPLRLTGPWTPSSLGELLLLPADGLRTGPPSFRRQVHDG